MKHNLLRNKPSFAEGVEGTSYAVTDLTPGRSYSFRVVTRSASLENDGAAADAGAVSAVAVVRLYKLTHSVKGACSQHLRLWFLYFLSTFNLYRYTAATASGAVAEGGDVSYSASGSSTSGVDFDAMDVDDAPELAFCGARPSAFPNGTLLLDGASVLLATPAACCLACSRAMVGRGSWGWVGSRADCVSGSILFAYTLPIRIVPTHVYEVTLVQPPVDLLATVYPIQFHTNTPGVSKFIVCSAETLH